MTVNPSRQNSIERVMCTTGIPSFMLDFREGRGKDLLIKVMEHSHLERFIGAIYRPMTERWSHYCFVSLSKQMDCLIWFDTSRAVDAFSTATAPDDDEAPVVGEIYPFSH